MSISFKEDHISQIPALLMLEKLGYTYLTPDEALALRGGNLANVLLEPVLRKQLAAINVVQVSSVRTTVFSEQNITAGIDALRNIPMDEGFMEASQTVYDLLTSGKTLEQIVDGDRKSFVMQYIDWKNPRNNVFHVTEEFAVSRTGMTETYRPDIVLFVNGIPLCVIECKRPDVRTPSSRPFRSTSATRRPTASVRCTSTRRCCWPSTARRAVTPRRPRPRSSGRGGASSSPTARRRPVTGRSGSEWSTSRCWTTSSSGSGSAMCAATLRSSTNSRSPRRCRTNTSTTSAAPSGCCS